MITTLQKMEIIM